MQVQMDNARDGGVCIRLIAETNDEYRMLRILDGSDATTVEMGAGPVLYLISTKIPLKGEESDPAPAVAE